MPCDVADPQLARNGNKMEPKNSFEISSNNSPDVEDDDDTLIEPQEGDDDTILTRMRPAGDFGKPWLSG